MTLYCLGTWDTEIQAYTPHDGVQAFNLTLHELRAALKQLRSRGYTCHRFRDPDGGHEDNDYGVMVEQMDGRTEAEILNDWRR